MNRDKGFVHIILIVVVVVAIIAVILFLGKDKLSSIVGIGTPVPVQLQTGTPVPTFPTSTSTPASSNLTTYINSKYHFEISFPSSYKALTDSDNLSGWPNAIALIYNGGQSYDLPIEVWNSESDYQINYPDPSLNIAVHKTSDGKFITLTNVNKDPEVDQIISTFKFTQ